MGGAELGFSEAGRRPGKCMSLEDEHGEYGTLAKDQYGKVDLIGNFRGVGPFGVQGNQRPQKHHELLQWIQKVIPRAAYMYVNWELVFSFMLMSSFIIGATANTCIREGTDPRCYHYKPFKQSLVPAGNSVVLAEFPVQQLRLEMTWVPDNRDFICQDDKHAINTSCVISTLDELEPIDTCISLNPSLQLLGGENGSQIRMHNVTEKVVYCMKVSGTEYYWFHQGSYGPTFNQSAPTCPALSMPTFVMKSGCNEDPSGQVKPGTTCHFSCPDGYIGRGDVNRTCLADGTWSNASFTCEAVTCPSDNVTKPYLEGCDPDSAGGIAIGSICSFPCDGCIDDARMVCLRNGTWLDISTNSQGDQPDFYKWAFVTTAIVFSVFCMILIYWCWNRKNEQGEHRSIFRAVYRKLRGDRAAGIDT